MYGSDQRRAFSLSTKWVPEMGTELRSPGLVASTLTCWPSHLDGQGRWLPYRPLTASSEILRAQSACFNITKQPKVTPFYHFYFLVLKQQCLAAFSCVSFWHYNCQEIQPKGLKVWLLPCMEEPLEIRCPGHPRSTQSDSLGMGSRKRVFTSFRISFSTHEF